MKLFNRMSRKPVISEEERQERLDAFGTAIAEKRDEAVSARKASGIEEVWMQCEESYLGIDDANRGEFGNARWAKPTSVDGPVATENNRANAGEVRSTAFVRLTSRYVDAGAAKLSEILLPIDDKAFSFDPTPVPDLITALEDKGPAMVNGQQVMRPPTPEELPPGSDPSQAPAVPMTVADVAKQQQDRAKDYAKKAETRIYDWMVECNYPAEMRKVIHDASRIGAGVLKGPFPDVSESKAVTKNGDAVELKIIKTIKPVTRWIDLWNLFPDGACGENIHHGDHILERDHLSTRRLKKLKGQSGYIDSQIDKVLKEGPGKCHENGGDNPNEKKNKKRFPIWYFYGTIKRDDMALANAIGIDALPADQDEVYAIVTLVNDSVIRATINPLGSGKFPYNVFPWSRRAGYWAGVGPGEQVSMPQRMVNAATRALLNNAGKSAGAQIVIDQSAIVPADGRWTITPDKIWYKLPESTGDDVSKAFMSVVFPNLGPQLMAIVDYAFKLAEEATNIPLITQGQTGPTTPDTFGAAQLQNNNANTLLRSVGYSVDDCITDPVVNDFYEYLLLDPNVPNDEKGDFKINAHGSIAMIEKAIQEQTMVQLGTLVKDPAFGADPKKWFAEMLKQKRLDPRSIQYTEEEMKKMAEQPPPEDPRITAAKIAAEATLKVNAGHDNTTLQRAKVDTDRDTAYNNSLAERDHANALVRMEELRLKRDLAMMDAAQREKKTIDEIKAALAQTAMKLNTQKELSANALQVDVHKHENPAPQIITPPIEPAGRAPNGHAYEA